MPSSPRAHITTNSIHPQIPSPPEGGAGAPYSTATKLRRLNFLILLLRFAAFCFCLAATISMISNSSRHTSNLTWHDFGLFRFEAVANGIVAIYYLLEMVVAIWEIVSGCTILPGVLQLWFDFGHDQVFAYMLLSAMATAAKEAYELKRGDTCKLESAFCVQTCVSVALGFVGLVFIAVSALLSGYRVAAFVITGSRFHVSARAPMYQL